MTVPTASVNFKLVVVTEEFKRSLLKTAWITEVGKMPVDPAVGVLLNIVMADGGGGASTGGGV